MPEKYSPTIFLVTPVYLDQPTILFHFILNTTNKGHQTIDKVHLVH